MNKKERHSLALYRPISLSDLELGTTHRGRVVYCRIATRVLKMNSVMVLVEDETALVDLAVYGLSRSSTNEFKEGRHIAIVEPFYKMRADGSEWIRVDEQTDIVFDAKLGEHPGESETAETISLERSPVEGRLPEMIQEDSTLGVGKLHPRLVAEGYNIKKQQVRALKHSILDLQDNGDKQQKPNEERAPKDKQEETDPSSPSQKIIPILSERRPEKARVLRATKVLEHRDAGNKAFRSGNYAEKRYTAALHHKDDKTESANTEEVHLWQLYSSSARLKFGLLDQALKGSLTANTCAPADATKPLLRVAETLRALGMQKELRDLLEAASSKFPEERDVFVNKKRALAPKQTLMVGKHQQFGTIADALRFASAGAEILVEEGVYHEALVITKPLTLRCISIRDDYAAIQGLEQGDDLPFAEIRVTGDFVVCCDTSLLSGGQVHIIGFQISCTASPRNSFHAVLAHTEASF